MIELVQMRGYYYQNGLKRFKDLDIDEIFLVETAIDAGGKPVTIRQCIGQVARKIGAAIAIHAEGVSGSVMRDVRLKVAERHAELFGGDTLQHYGEGKESHTMGVGTQ